LKSRLAFLLDSDSVPSSAGFWERMLFFFCSLLERSSLLESFFLLEENCSEQQMVSEQYPGHSETRGHQCPFELVLVSSNLEGSGFVCSQAWFLEQELGLGGKSILHWAAHLCVRASDQMLC
jgi:hypothetical protein